MGFVTISIAVSPMIYISSLSEVFIHSSLLGVALSERTSQVSFASLETSLFTIDFLDRIKSFAFLSSAASSGIPSLKGFFISIPSSVPTLISISVIEVTESAYGTFSKSSLPISLIIFKTSGLKTSSDSISKTMVSLLPKSSLNLSSCSFI